MKPPNFADMVAQCSMIEKIAKSFPEDSAERDALAAASQAMQYVSHVDTQAKFRAWVDSWAAPPTALQVLNAKLAGIDDLPHELMDDTLKEIEHLMERLRQKST